jgi:hypothetical protein
VRQLALVILTAGLALSLAPAARAHAQAPITYPAGWVLVSGPDGTTFPAATALFAYPPGASGYSTPDNGATGGEGLWAYFPNGGSPVFGSGGPCAMTLETRAGQPFIAGNPSATMTATVTGAQAMYTFDPTTQQYTATPTLAPGQGAWVFPSGGTVTITACATATSSPAQPRPSPSPSPAPVVVSPAQPQQPAPATSSSTPAGATAQCRDGTYSYSQHRSGTCSGHGGVGTWINPPPSRVLRAA